MSGSNPATSPAQTEEWAPDAAALRAHVRRRQEDLLDEAIEASFPASDPIAAVQLLASR